MTERHHKGVMKW